MTPVEPIDFTCYRRVVVLTGAGISVASGLRPFRGPGGLWEDEDVVALADVASLTTNPDGLWRLSSAIRTAACAAEPNEGHRAIARLQARLAGRASVTVLTQNVDGLHQRAGTDSVLELHGNASRTRCADEACTSEPFADDRAPVTPPRCPRCGAMQRPDIVLFGEFLPVGAEWAARTVLRECDLFLAVGTSGTVSPASNYVRSAAYAGPTRCS